LNQFYKISKSFFANNSELFIYFTQCVILLSLSNFKLEKGISEISEIRRAKKAANSIKKILNAEIKKIEYGPKLTIYHKNENSINHLESQILFDKYLEIIKTKLLVANENLPRILKQKSKDLLLNHKGFLNGIEFIELITQKIKFPLSEIEGNILKKILEKEHKDQIFISDLLKFVAPKSIRDLNLLIDISLNEEIILIGFFLTIAFYHKNTEKKIINEIKEEDSIKKSLNYFNEFNTFLKNIRNNMEDKRIENAFLNLSKIDPKYNIKPEILYGILKQNGIIQNFYDYLFTNNINNEKSTKSL